MSLVGEKSQTSAQLSPRLCTLTVTWKSRRRGEAGNRPDIYLNLLSLHVSHVLPLHCYWFNISTINVLWPNAVEPLPECPNVLWSEIQMEKLVLERWETGDWSIIEIF